MFALFTYEGRSLFTMSSLAKIRNLLPFAGSLSLGRRIQAQLVQEDALSLISRYQDQAYREARDRARGKCLEDRRSAAHWRKVKLTIAMQQGIRIGTNCSAA
ncbi:hypothetical protein [Beijerinckia mobilis]|uniref:hypothetical protein n=1 Tax=Beijerinckia mobilis TaxID=231434 RepID=UPI000551640E|nr:hypothetical protein [Beijerinckia mobilis]